MNIFNRVKRADGDTTSTGNLVDAILVAGDLVQTKGFNNPGDRGSARYLIQTPAEYGGTPDETSDHTLANGT